MAKLTKVRTKKKPRETVLVDGEWEAARDGNGWVISHGPRHPVTRTGPMPEKHVRCMLSLSRKAYECGRWDVQRTVRAALGLGR